MLVWFNVFFYMHGVVIDILCLYLDVNIVCMSFYNGATRHTQSFKWPVMFVSTTQTDKHFESP